MEDNIRYNFICVNYNGSSFCKMFIQSVEKIAKHTNNSIRIIIVDNNSNPDDFNKLLNFKTKYSELKVVKSQQNLGYFGGMNVGISIAKESSNDLLIIGNNDLEFNIDFIKKYRECEYDENVLVISPDVITKDGVHQNPLAIHKINWLSKLMSDIYYINYYVALTLKTLKKIVIYNNSSESKNVYHKNKMFIKRGIGACYILTEHFFKHYDKLDDRVFMWGEEALLSNQVETVGGKTLYDPSLIVNHFESGTVKKMLSKDKYNIVKKSYAIYNKYL